MKLAMGTRVGKSADMPFWIRVTQRLNGRNASTFSETASGMSQQARKPDSASLRRLRGVMRSEE
jgi:hypothetical protein